MRVLQNFLNLKEPPSHGDWTQTGETFNYVFILRQHSGIGTLKIIVILSAIYG